MGTQLFQGRAPDDSVLGRSGLPDYLVTARSPEEVEGLAEEVEGPEDTGGPPGLVVSHTMDPSSATVDSCKARVTLLNNNWCLKLHFFMICEGGALRPAHNDVTKNVIILELLLQGCQLCVSTG